MAIYNQQAFTIEGQTLLLTTKNLIISEPDYVKHCLSHLGYHRLKHYTYKFKDESRNFIPIPALIKSLRYITLIES